ncbi:MAG: hypothetical protein J6J22_07120 [Alistipes sp.]|nr:hypothetical protein [Alistipes sp.]MBP3644404.1 hypothetical protein [Alistipes sp.]
MNKFFIISILTLFTVGVHAQSIKVNETDPFNGKSKIQTSAVKTSYPKGEMSMKVNDGIAYFCIMATADYVDMEEGDEAKILFLTKENNIVELDVESVNTGVVEKKSNIHWGFGISSGKSKQLTSLFLEAIVPVEAFEQIYTERVSIIRLIAGKTEIDIDIASPTKNSCENSLWRLFKITRKYIIPEE